MKIKKLSFSIIFILLTLTFIPPVFCAELDGWIKSKTCWVVERPSKDAKVIGIIKWKAAVTIEDLGNGWARTIYAPVRNLINGYKGMKMDELYNCKDCYIEIKNFSTLPPNRW